MIKRVNEAENERGANEINKILKYERENCYLPSRNGCYLKSVFYFFKRSLAKKFPNSNNRIKEEEMSRLDVEIQIFVSVAK